MSATRLVTMTLTTTCAMASPASTAGPIAATARTLRRVCSSAPKSHALLNPHADALTRSLGALASIRGERVRRLGASAQTHASPSTTTRAGKANEWRGPRYGKGGRGGAAAAAAVAGAVAAAVPPTPPSTSSARGARSPRTSNGASPRCRRSPTRAPRPSPPSPRAKPTSFSAAIPSSYGGAVDALANGKSDAPPRTGDPIIVADHEGKALAWGVYNDTSQYVVRILRMAWECELAPHPGGVSSSASNVAVKCDVEEVIRDKINVAARMRSDCGVAVGNANGPTTVYRLVNSEGDGLSGVCVDVYDCGGEGGGGKVAVAAVSAAWAHMRRDAVVKALGECAGIDRVLWRTTRACSSWRESSMNRDPRRRTTGPNREVAAPTANRTPGQLDPANRCRQVLRRQDRRGDLAARRLGHCRGERRAVRGRPDEGHKTGFYVDQRDNRAEVKPGAGKKRSRRLLLHRRVRDQRRAGRRRRRTGVDSSPLALDIARRNADVNGVGARTTFVQSEAFKYLDDLVADSGNLGTFDMIVLDPPKLAPSANAGGATRKYVKMNGRRCVC